jgi:hypothetical protein
MRLIINSEVCGGRGGRVFAVIKKAAIFCLVDALKSVAVLFVNHLELVAVGLLPDSDSINLLG